jgi:pimeloyl-ACP methyl ester carboxylesterase
MTAVSGPRLLDAAALLSQVADELVVRTVRDTHEAVLDRARVRGRLHRGITSGVYGGLGAGCRAASAGLGALADRGLGPELDDTTAGRFVTSAVAGLIGDRLARERPRLALPLAVRIDGRDVPLEQDTLATAFPDSTPRVAVLLHGLSENESAWSRHRDVVGASYPDTLAELGWSPVLLRANTGLGLRENGVALAVLLRDLLAAWPHAVERLTLVGHSMGGLVLRAACAVATEEREPWTARVAHVVTLGTPHHGAPLAGGVGAGARALARLPETAAFGRILDQRSAGVLDLVRGLGEEVPPLPHARYHLVSATLTRSPRHPVARVLGDVLVRQQSAYGVSRRGDDLFPEADRLHLPGAGHFDLLNHPDVHAALREWLV